MRAVRPDSEQRLNVLLTDGQDEWTEQLPLLLEPHGVRSIRVHDVDEAVRAIEREPVHAAVVEVEWPQTAARQQEPGREPGAERETGGLKLLQVIRRIEQSPPAVVIRDRQFDGRFDNRLLNEALKLDAFSVLDEPVELEQLLETLRRLIKRYYGDAWPQR